MKDKIAREWCDSNGRLIGQTQNAVINLSSELRKEFDELYEHLGIKREAFSSGHRLVKSSPCVPSYQELTEFTNLSAQYLASETKCQALEAEIESLKAVITKQSKK